ncbi:hypothetical protein Gogos_017925, partial [Gossypium gossypioides]|nr:hypothetical protein [Gossypium gossypioides]
NNTFKSGCQKSCLPRATVHWQGKTRNSTWSL